MATDTHPARSGTQPGPECLAPSQCSVNVERINDDAELGQAYS